MRHLLVLVSGIVLSCGLAGCAQDLTKHEAALGDVTKAMTDLADSVESVKDAATAKAAAVKINKVCDKMEELTETMQKLPKVRKADDDKITAKFKPDLEKAATRLTNKDTLGTFAIYAYLDEDLKKSMDRFQSVMTKMQTASKAMGQ